MKQTASAIEVRRSHERGQADHGWLQSHHTFSFAEYQDPAHMGFRTLRVINEDWVAPGQGFGTHPHRDMEIFSYVLEGAIQHRDSLGNGRILTPGQIQLMSAGQGVTHSEFNPSTTDSLHLLQIWIRPHTRGLTPSYTEWHPQPEQARNPKVLVISPDGREGSAIIHQEAKVYRLRWDQGQILEHNLHPGRGVWLQVMSGGLAWDAIALGAGDAASSEEPGKLVLNGSASGEALLFDLG
jgi:redox-sensitive bicupin YhaK (pirin superfamily)